MLGTLLKGVGKIIKRAVTKDGGGLLKLSNEAGKFDLVAAGALAIRVGLAVLILYIAAKTGFTVEQILEVVNQLGE